LKAADQRRTKHLIYLSVEHVYLWRLKDFTSITRSWGSRLEGRHVGAPLMDGCTAHDVAERSDIPSACDNAQFVDPGEGNEDEEEREPMDISRIPDAFIADRNDATKQATVLEEIIGTTLVDPGDVDEFDYKMVKKLKLSVLKRRYERGERGVVDLLSERHKILIDKEFKLPISSAEIRMNADVMMLDYHIMVGNCIGLGALLPASEVERFCFEMDLQKPYSAGHPKCVNLVNDFLTVQGHLEKV
jgi:hypothetical protein